MMMMIELKYLLGVLFFLAAVLRIGHAVAFPDNPPGDPIGAIRDLVSRIIGEEYVDNFLYEIIPSENGNDVFEIDGDSTYKLPVFRGNNGVALASAFNFYLKYWCNCSVSWGRNGTGDQLNLPKSFPIPNKLERKVFPNRFRYYLNVCTVSYSMAWWNWTRWEREIDWMALNGLNFILSFTGQEYVKLKFYRALGLTENEIKTFFSGAAFLAWQRMGNLRGWGGPLDDKWIKKQWDLQNLIVERQRHFGMINIFPGFAGHVPAALKRVYPNANLTRSSDWNRLGEQYSEDYFLHPSDPLFKTIGQMYYKILIDEIGTDHYYNSDAFNEMEPASADSEYLANANAQTYEAMAAVDKDAVYVMQGWLFKSKFWDNTSRVQAYLSGVPDDKMIILDLESESSPIYSKTKFYFGKPFIWCLLHNFGGNRGIYGNLTTIGSAPVEARNTPGSTMVGVGMTPEAIEHNPVVYELMGEMSWRSEPVTDVMEWLDGYITRRYGNWTQNIHNAWQLLYDGAYQFHWSRYAQAAVSHQPGRDYEPDRKFNVSKIAEAWRLLVTEAASSEILDPSIGPLRYDIVDIGRQVLCNLFTDLYTMIKGTYTQFESTKDPALIEGVEIISSAMIEMIQDIELLLATDTNFLLGHWINEARASAAPKSKASVLDNLEFNARNQITMWGPEHNIEDYADKQWAGMFGEYYYDRWKLYTTRMADAMKRNETFDLEKFQNIILYGFERVWNYDIKSFPDMPEGDTINVAEFLLQKYFKGRDYLMNNYDVIVDRDVKGNDLYGQGFSLWTDMREQLVWLCEINPKCAGFTYPHLSFKNSTVDTIVSAGNTVYSKKNK